MAIDLQIFDLCELFTTNLLEVFFSSNGKIEWSRYAVEDEDTELCWVRLYGLLYGVDGEIQTQIELKIPLIIATSLDALEIQRFLKMKKDMMANPDVVDEDVEDVETRVVH